MRSMTVSVVLAVLLCLNDAVGETVRDIRLFKGRSDSVAVDGEVTRIIVLDEKIVNARPHEDGQSVLVIGVDVGKAQVRIQRRDLEDLVYNVAVMLETTQLADELRELLSNIYGLDVKTLGNRVTLTGTLSIYEDFQQVAQVAEAYKGDVLNMTRFDASRYKDLLAKAIARDIGLDTVTVTITGDRGERARLEGYVYDEKQVERSASIARTRVQEVDNLLSVEEVMIETDVMFLQFDSKSGTDFGYNVLRTLGLEATLEGGGRVGGMNTFSYAVAGGLGARINALISDGSASVVARPHLSTKSGGEGRFLSGGELGFSIAGNIGGTLEKVEYGVKLTVKPTLRGREQIDTHITVEVSVPTSTGVGGYSLDKFETTSIVKCNIGESIIVSGIKQTLETRFAERTPLLGRIPILRAFFSERKTQGVERELVVVLTPQPVFPRKGDGPFSKQHEDRL